MRNVTGTWLDQNPSTIRRPPQEKNAETIQLAMKTYNITVQDICTGTGLTTEAVNNLINGKLIEDSAVVTNHALYKIDKYFSAFS